MPFEGVSIRHSNNPVWHFFQRNQETKIADCNYCQKSLSYKSTVTNLKQHLKVKHINEYDELIAMTKTDGRSNQTITTLLSKNENTDSEDNEDEEEQQFVFQRCASFTPPSPQAGSTSSLPSHRPKKTYHKKSRPKESYEISNSTMIADVNEINEYFQNKKVKIETTSDELDSKKMFLLSLLPDVNAMSDGQMRKFKRGVLNLIGDILEDGPTTSSLP